MIGLNNNCSYLTDKVSETMKTMANEVGVNEEMWDLASLRVWEVFCRFEDRPITLENFKWTKRAALGNIHDDQELENCSECSKICLIIEELFNRIYDPTGDPTGSVLGKEMTPPRTVQAFISQLTKTPPSDPSQDFLLTYQTFDLLKKEMMEAIPKEDPRYSEIEASANEVFAKIKWQNTLNKENISEFLEIYRDFVIAKCREKENSCFLKDQWITDENHAFDLNMIYNREFDYRNLEVTLPLEKIKEIYESHGVVQLRPIDKTATTVIIGCGNGRLSDGGGCSLPFKSERWSVNSTYGDYICKYSVNHLHPGVVTIDPSLSANPAILAYFGDQPVSQLFDGQKFDRIIFEGYFDRMPQTFRKSDLSELLSENGMIYLDRGAGPELLENWRKDLIASEL